MRLVRSLLRIVTAAVVLGAMGFLALAVALRQPVVTATAWRGGARADARTLEAHVRFLTNDVRPRGAAYPENLDRAARYIAGHFRAAGGRTSLQTFDARGRRYSNVVAEFGPASSGDAVLVIGAHYDAFTETGPLPGADDNASGTAGLIELARLLGRSDVRRPVVLVAYTTEEPPFFGSEQMGSAVHAASLASPVRGMICLEMIGYFAETQSWPNALFRWIYPTRGDFIGVAGGWNDRHLAREVKRAIAGAGGIRVVSFSGPRETSDASDHRNYWARGWPAVMVTDTAFLRNPHYHTAHDTAETLDYARMARVVDGVLNAAL
ncbi:MAG TPA: M28 family peptidase [Thermoanaerobaculia bacterium]|nr:M28 family peptidase [Thermoanaerobaculia bacterium]